MEPEIPDLSRLAPELLDALEPADRAALEHALAEAEPGSLRALAEWVAMRDRVAGELASDLPPADLLVLYALDERAGALSQDERIRLDSVRGELEAALSAHPGLQSVVDRIRSERDAFEALWDEELASPPLRAGDRPSRPGRAHVSRTRRLIWRAAAVAAVILFAASLMLIAQRDAGFETVRTAEGETVVLSLPDGSEARLGPSTSFSYLVVPDARREVRVSGEVLIEVAASRSPFTVETPEALVTVLGTTFGVVSEGARTEVVLVTGSLELASRARPDATVRLAPGERSEVLAGQAPRRPVEVDVAEALAWTGTWYFRSSPLQEISERLSTHYGVRIDVPQSLAAERVSGAFSRDAPVEETLQTLAAALGTRVEREAPGWYRFAAPGG